MKGERRLSFNDLRDVLSKFGYELIEEGTMASIRSNGNEVERVLKKGKQGLEEYDQSYLSELRKRLNLTVDYGIDSARFYGQKGINDELNEFMEMRGEVFRKLAKI
jgi:death-on-curing protein